VNPLVIGGSGFIGSHLCAELKTARSADMRDADYICDIRIRKQVEQLFNRCRPRSIVHLASMLQTAAGEHPRFAVQINLLGWLNVLQAAVRTGAVHVIFASSMSVYGSATTTLRRGVRESDPAAPEDLYGTLKKAAEITGNRVLRDAGISFTSLRIPIVIGPGVSRSASSWRGDLFDPGANQVTIPYAADEILPVVHVRQLAMQIKRLLSVQPLDTVYNAPCLCLSAAEIASAAQQFNPDLRVHFGDRRIQGFPSFVDSARFCSEFNFAHIPIGEWRDL